MAGNPELMPHALDLRVRGSISGLLTIKRLKNNMKITTWLAFPAVVQPVFGHGRAKVGP
jgi:hypothetical protein